MPNQPIIPADVAKRYEVFEWRNGLAILASAHPDKWSNILEVLRGFSFTRSDVLTPGGAKGLIASNRFILHCILRKIAKKADVNSSDTIVDAVVEEAVLHVLSKVGQIIDKDYADAYLAPLFKNVKKCTDIRAKLEKS